MENIVINPQDNIPLTGQLVYQLYQLVGEMPARASAEPLIELKRQVTEFYKARDIQKPMEAVKVIEPVENIST